jgi:hypothetical protein
MATTTGFSRFAIERNSPVVTTSPRLPSVPVVATGAGDCGGADADRVDELLRAPTNAPATKTTMITRSMGKRYLRMYAPLGVVHLVFLEQRRENGGTLAVGRERSGRRHRRHQLRGWSGCAVPVTNLEACGRGGPGGFDDLSGREI